MKAVVALAILLAVASAIDVCLPDEFIVDEVTFDYEKQDTFGMRTFYNKHYGVSRTDIDFMEEDSVVISERITFLSDYKSGKYYTIIYNLTAQTANCSVRNIQGNLPRICLSKNAEHRGSVVLGGVLHCDNYIEKLKHGQVAIDALLVKNTNIPIRVYDYTRENSALTEYWNFEEKAPFHHFQPPHVCDNAEEGYLDALSLHKLAKFSPILNA